jgi:hypothetical protein
MKVFAHTYVTNALEYGYLIYLPAIQIFLDLADEVIIIDGGSTDGTLERLRELREAERLIVHVSDQTYWGADDAWKWPQFAI